MNLRPTDYPLYLYVIEIKKQRKIYFEGDLCDGRKPTKDEMEVFIKNGMPNIHSHHFFHSLHNPQEHSITFLSFEDMVTEAKRLYAETGCKKGLILGYDCKNPPQDKVLIYEEEKCKNEADFIAQARKNNYWSKYFK